MIDILIQKENLDMETNMHRGKIIEDTRSMPSIVKEATRNQEKGMKLNFPYNHKKKSTLTIS